jgi:hypothetical protein
MTHANTTRWMEPPLASRCREAAERRHAALPPKCCANCLLMPWGRRVIVLYSTNWRIILMELPIKVHSALLVDLQNGARLSAVSILWAGMASVTAGVGIENFGG